MIASIWNFILFLILVYLILYGVYLLTINLKALLSSGAYMTQESERLFEGKENFKQNKICVLIFANSKTKKLEALLRALNEQTYSKENYSTHVIFAKDSNSLLYTPDCMAGAQIHRIENAEFFKKDKALNVFIEKLISVAKFDAYVFLGSNRRVQAQYLENINCALNKTETGVITGKTTIFSSTRCPALKDKLLEIKQEFKNNTVNISRKMFNLSTVIDSENCVMTSEILEKTGRVCFETREDELKYSLFLASNSIYPEYCPYMEAFSEAEFYNPATAGASVRFSLFRYYLKLLCNKPWKFVEFALSLIYPNVAVALFLYLLLFYTSFRFISSVEIKYVLHLGVFYLAVWAVGIAASKLSFSKILTFVLYPMYSLVFNVVKFTREFANKSLQKSISEERSIQSDTIDAVVTDGQKDVVCKMDLISEDGMRRVILRFRKKRVISDESIRMHDSVESISKKIHNRGLTLKICQNCAYFTSLQDGTVDLLKGTCAQYSSPEQGEGEKFETLIWNTCNRFRPKAQSSMIENINNDME